MTCIYSMIFLAGVVGNISTCIVIAKNRYMHTATNYYLFSLAISDLLLLILGLPMETYDFWIPNQFPYGEKMCIAKGIASEASTNATVLTITAFTVERYIAICHPFLSHTMSKLSRVVRYVVAIWVISLSAAVPQAIQFGLIVDPKGGSICILKDGAEVYAFTVSALVFFVGPMTVITVLYILISVKLRTSRVLHPSKKPSLESGSGHGNGHAIGSTRRGYKNSRSQRRVIKMLVAVTLSFFVCWAPFHAQRMLAVYGNRFLTQSDTLIEVFMVVTHVSGIMYYLSTAVNPFLYNILSNKFREAFKMTLAQTCGHDKSAASMNRTYSALYAPRNHRPGLTHRRPRTSLAPPPRNRVSSNSSNITALTSLTTANLTGVAALDRSASAVILRSVSEVSEGSGSRLARQLRRVLEMRGRDSKPGGQTRAAFLIATHSDSVDSARSISNSSLRDLDEDEYTGEELATYMEQINNNIDTSRQCDM